MLKEVHVLLCVSFTCKWRRENSCELQTLSAALAKFHSERAGQNGAWSQWKGFLSCLLHPLSAGQVCPVRQSLLCLSQFPSVPFHHSVLPGCLQHIKPLPNQDFLPWGEAFWGLFLIFNFLLFFLRVIWGVHPLDCSEEKWGGAGGWLVQVWCSPAAHRAAQFGNCLKEEWKENTGQVSESQRGIVI